MSDDTQALVSRAQRGDRAAFGALYERLAPKVYNYLYYQLDGRAQLAEDLAEDVFVKVLQKLDRYRDRGLPFSAWVFRIAQNHLIDHVRAQPRRGTVAIEDCHGLAEPGAEGALEASLTSAELAGALAGLTAEQRQVVTLRFLQGCNITETAAALGKSEDAVKKLQARGLAALRRALRAEAAALVA